MPLPVQPLKHLCYRTMRIPKITEINPLNKKFDHKSDSTHPIFLFYHIYCGPNDWEGIVSEQLSIIKMSGLWKKINKFFITIIGSEYEQEKIKELFKEVSYEIVYASDDASCFEFPSLERMKELSGQEKFYAVYIHTKGASYSRKEKFDSITHNDWNWKLRQLMNWRMLMNYFVLYKWNIAVNALNEGYQAYGILKRNLPCPHFSGNFWWSNSELIKSAVNIDVDFKKDRYNAEFWILSGCKETEKIYSPFERGLLLTVELTDNNRLNLLPWWHKKNLLYLLNSFIR